jgi:hypothetical protein
MAISTLNSYPAGQENTAESTPGTPRALADIHRVGDVAAGLMPKYALKPSKTVKNCSKRS